MYLRAFVAETLKQIVEGVVAAQQEVTEHVATVNAWGITSADGSLQCINNSALRIVQMVDFDISLGETEGDEKGARTGVFFTPVGLGAQAKSEVGTSAMNRVRFSMPIMLPSHHPRTR